MSGRTCDEIARRFPRPCLRDAPLVRGDVPRSDVREPRASRQSGQPRRSRRAGRRHRQPRHPQLRPPERAEQHHQQQRQQRRQRNRRGQPAPRERAVPATAPPPRRIRRYRCPGPPGIRRGPAERRRRDGRAGGGAGGGCAGRAGRRHGDASGPAGGGLRAAARGRLRRRVFSSRRAQRDLDSSDSFHPGPGSCQPDRGVGGRAESGVAGRGCLRKGSSLGGATDPLRAGNLRRA